MKARWTDYVKLVAVAWMIFLTGFVVISLITTLFGYLTHLNTWGSPLFTTLNPGPWVYIKAGMGFTLFLCTVLVWVASLGLVVHRCITRFGAYYAYWKITVEEGPKTPDLKVGAYGWKR